MSKDATHSALPLWDIAHLESVKPGIEPMAKDPIGSARKMCLDKTRYPDKKSAATYLNSFQRRGRGRHGRPQWLRSYPCPYCHGWHVTKGKPKK